MSRARIAATIAGLALAISLAGCAEDAGTVKYHGEGAGIDTAGIVCEEGAPEVTVSVTYRGDFGKRFNVRALTPVNKEAALNETFTLPGPDDKTETFRLPAIRGVWELRVERLDPFKGNLEVRGACDRSPA